MPVRWVYTSMTPCGAARDPPPLCDSIPLQIGRYEAFLSNLANQLPGNGEPTPGEGPTTEELITEIVILRGYQFKACELRWIIDRAWSKTRWSMSCLLSTTTLPRSITAGRFTPRSCISTCFFR
ncbi:MAG: hypothetical protein OHK0039_40580 [Bacteroidia bacterium]